MLEKNVYVLNKVLGNTIYIINEYLNDYSRTTKKKEMFKIISEKLYKKPVFEESIKKNMTNYLLDLININDVDEIKFFLEINLEINGIEDTDLSGLLMNPPLHHLDFLDDKTKLRIIEVVYQCEKLRTSQKEFITKSILDDSIIVENQDMMLNSANFCKNPDYKEGLWKMFIYKDLNYTDKEIDALMKGLGKNREIKDSRADINKYYKKGFFKSFPLVFSMCSHSYVNSFYNYLNPAFIMTEKILKKMLKLKSSLHFEDMGNNQLRLMMENDIVDLRYKLIVEKSYSHLQLNSYKKFIL
jgi:hypothetical protein